MLGRGATRRRVLIQWVPHAYRYRSMNLPFCLWVWKRAMFERERVEIVVHEPYLGFRRHAWKQNGAALVHRVMTSILLNAAHRVWTAIPQWEAYWRSYALGRRVPFRWLPVPSTVPLLEDAAGVAATRARYTADGGLVAGHLGTYATPIAEVLVGALPELLRDRLDLAMLLLGRGSERLRA